MKAVVCQHADLRVDELPEPVPAGGQVRLRVLRCGICGSDLHARTGSDEWAEMAERSGYHRFARSDQPVVYGHEFCGEVAEHGPKTRGTVPTGTPTVALPLLRNDGIVDPTGLSQHAPGGYAGARPGVPDVAGAQRAGGGGGGVDRAYGRRLA